MSALANPPDTGVAHAPASRQRSLERSSSSMLVCPAEVALLRVNSKPGTTGNELILRSGVIIQLTYREADALKEDLLHITDASESERHLRKMLFDIDL